MTETNKSDFTNAAYGIHSPSLYYVTLVAISLIETGWAMWLIHLQEITMEEIIFLV